MKKNPDCLDVAGDTLAGVAAIGRFIGKSSRQTTYLLENRRLPAFKLGAIWHMRKSAYVRHLSRLEAAFQGFADTGPREAA